MKKHFDEGENGRHANNKSFSAHKMAKLFFKQLIAVVKKGRHKFKGDTKSPIRIKSRRQTIYHYLFLSDEVNGADDVFLPPLLVTQ